MQNDLEKIEQELQIFTKSQKFNPKNKQAIEKIEQLESTIETLKLQLTNTQEYQDPHELKFEVHGKVTKRIVDLYYEAQKDLQLAPSPLELLHDQLCDYHVIQQSKLYRSASNGKMMRSRSAGRSQLLEQTGLNTEMHESIARIGDMVTFYGQLTGYKPIIPKSKSVSFSQVYNLILKLTPKHCMGVTLDSQAAQRLLEDAHIIPNKLSVLKYQVLFQRATYLQTKLFLEITENNDNTLLAQVYKAKLSVQQNPDFTAFNFNQIKKISYLGIIFLFYAVAEQLEQKQQYQPKYQPRAMRDPYDTYQYNEEVEDFSQMVVFTNSWKLVYCFGQLLDQYILYDNNCTQFGLLTPKPKLTPDLHNYPSAILVFSKHTHVIKQLFRSLNTESQLMDYNQLYKVCATAGIHQQLTRDFCYELVFRLFSKVDKASFIPGLDEDEFLIAIFVCSNFALYKEPFVQKFKTPESRLDYVLQKLSEKI